MAEQQQTAAPTDSDASADEALHRARSFTSRTAPATVATCRDDYAAGAELRSKFDATAKRQYATS
jgi:hypothetical protein